MLPKVRAMTTEEIIHKVDHILVDEFELEEDLVVPEANLREDLDLDSLDAMDLVTALEKTFGFRIDEKLIGEMKTVGDIHEHIREHFGNAEQIEAARRSA